MLNFIAIINKIFAIFTILTFSGIFFLSVQVYIDKRSEKKSKFIRFIGENFILFSFLISLFAVVISLFYSEIVGYEPCNLCWFQRVFIYPIAVISGIALWRKKYDIADFVLGLSIFGIFFAIYNHLIQIGYMPSVFCLTSAVSCAKRYVFEFGFVTMPLMSLALFCLLIVLAFINKIYRD